ncbi:MAG TPA: alpha/beta fold hydrolase [Thermoanaerobaculia bacterium]|nr:alpha/beta fold hydrolase [Thermoanaerobaculia bacterium]
MSRSLCAALVLSFVAIAAAADQGAVQTLTVTSKALEGNLTGDPAEQRFAVYTPPGYAAGNARYPVIVLLHGIGDSSDTWLNDFHIAAMLDRLITSNQMPPVIVVMPNARNRFLGSYYLNSPVTGRWSDLIADEIVPMVDGKFRTLTGPAHRAVLGHSMGGFGAIVFGMTRPDVFGLVYAISPCCLDAVEDVGIGNVQAWTTVLTFKGYDDVDAELKKGDFYPVALVGLLAATMPKSGAPLNVEIPVARVRGELMRVHPAYEDWVARFPVHAVAAHRENLLKLRLLALDVGYDDQFAHIPPSVMSFSRALFDERIPHRLDVYQGDHRQKVAARLEQTILPLLAKSLARD